jgi:hypothetical protein
MRTALTLVLFVILGVVLAGSAVTALLSAPISSAEVWTYFPWIVAGGFAVALVISYFLAGTLLKRAGSNAG